MKFTKGGYYYSLGWRSDDNDQLSVIVDTWVYRGIVHSECSSSSCDVPGEFHAFESPILGSEPVLVPSMAQAELSYLTWPEFMAAIPMLNDGLKTESAIQS